MPNSYTTMKTIRRRNPDFFGDQARAVTGSILESRVYGNGLFITSEQPRDENGAALAPRTYTVRRAMDVRHPTGRTLPAIQNVAGGYGAYDTLAAAEIARQWYQALMDKRGADLLREMQAVASDGETGFTALSSPTGGFSLICATPEHVASAQKTQRDGRDMVIVHFADEDDAKDCIVSETPDLAEWWSNIAMAAKGLPVGAFAFADPKQAGSA